LSTRRSSSLGEPAAAAVPGEASASRSAKRMPRAFVAARVPAVSTPVAVAVFVVSLVATLAAAGVFARRLDVLGAHLGLPEALLGLLPAAGAHPPARSSALATRAAGPDSG